MVNHINQTKNFYFLNYFSEILLRLIVHPKKSNVNCIGILSGIQIWQAVRWNEYWIYCTFENLLQFEKTLLFAVMINSYHGEA